MKGATKRLVVAAFIVMAATAVLPPAHGRPVARCFGRAATIEGSPANDRIYGTVGADVIVAGSGDDEIVASDGDDRICAGAGSDRVEARYGHDLVAGGAGDDSINGGPGSDHLDGDQDSDDINGGAGEREDSDTMVGDLGDDRLRSGSGTHLNSLFGGDGRDYLTGAEFEDWFYPGADENYDVMYATGSRAADRVVYKLHHRGIVAELLDATPPHDGSHPESWTHDELVGVNNVVGSLFDDELIGDADGNVLRGLDGNDAIQADSGDDLVDGGLGDDSLQGGPGEDVLDHFDSPVGVEVSLRSSTASGGGEDAVVEFENLYGSNYDDRLEGDDLSNSLAGRYGEDTLFGLGGDDVLYQGSDSSDGGEGHDLCWDMYSAAGCESSATSDGGPDAIVTFPLQGQIYEPGQVTQVEAAGRDGFGGSVERVRVGLHTLAESGCRWWRQRSARFVVRPCGLPLWNARIRIDDGLRQAGFYEVRTYMDVDPSFGSETFQTEGDRASFRIQGDG